MLCDPRTESLIEIYIDVVPPIKQARAQLNSGAAFARPDGPDGTKGLDAAHPPPISIFTKGAKGGTMADARLGRLFGRRIERDLWQLCGEAGRPVAREYARHEQTSDVTRLHPRSG